MKHNFRNGAIRWQIFDIEKAGQWYKVLIAQWCIIRWQWQISKFTSHYAHFCARSHPLRDTNI